MILFTGGGDIANKFAEKYVCETMSLRNKSREDLEKILSSYDVVVHNAANINPKSLEEATDDNFTLTKNIVDILVKVNPNVRFIYLSSMSILESEGEYLDPLQMTSYAFSKYLGEIYTQAVLKTSLVVRFSTIFYEKPHKDGLSKLVSDALEHKRVVLFNEGIAKRDFIPIEILVDYLYKLSIGESVNKTYTICSGVSTSFAQIVEIIKERQRDLNIENIKIENTVEVLSDFSTNSLEELGVIPFKLEYYIDKYVAKLKNENADI